MKHLKRTYIGEHVEIISPTAALCLTNADTVFLATKGIFRCGYETVFDRSIFPYSTKSSFVQILLSFF